MVVVEFVHLAEPCVVVVCASAPVTVAAEVEL